MASKLLEELKSLKLGLASIELKVDNSTAHIVKRETIHERLENKFSSFLELNNKRLVFNCGGKLFETTTTTIENCSYNNILKSYGNLPKDPSGNVFVDINPKFFKVLMEFIRQTNNQIFERTTTIPIKMTINFDKQAFKETLTQFFIDEDVAEITEKFFNIGEVKNIPVPVVVPVINPDPYGYGGDARYGY